MLRELCFCLALFAAWTASGCAHLVPSRAREVKLGGEATGLTQAELQQAVQRVTGIMTQRLTQAADPLFHPQNPRRTEQVLRRVLLYQSAALDMASGPRPEINLLDMLVFATLSRDAFEDHWLPKVFGEPSRPMLRALKASEGDVWKLADDVLNTTQQDQVHEYIRDWQASHPKQAQVEAVRLSDFSSLVDKSPQAKKARGLLASVKLAAKAADEALLLGERALFLGQRMPFLLRTQVRLGTMEVMSDSLGQLARAEGLVDRSEALVESVNGLIPTIREADALTARAESVVTEARRLVNDLAPLLEVLPRSQGMPATRIELIAESSRQTKQPSSQDRSGP